MINSGNQHVIFDNPDITKKYDELTKWSDFNVILPMLFLFYHGIETLFKGLIFLKDPNNNSIKKLQHNLKELFNETKINYPELSFMKSLEKYLCYNKQTPLILKEFIDSNDDIKNMDDLYFVLRYPTNKSKKVNYDYINLKYKGRDGLPFAQELKELIKNICLQTVKESRKIEDIIKN